ncbi:DHH family phosphoesterase [Phytopseudomonas seleniipraecipitans]|uniref:Oligoribonuclease NrnB or cAMP/cGMP phosphodiesterase, DHH superfamily n=1 Tax=Phytopseudomonas seleniipraecipitans TaxID=640205 RepID=A0A1G7JET5_9GAMM|nr:DHHA1 domain-containing protein [Pseudomonas seleniipraecipitans]SDF23385.1 Oligoribonuclease NrnB or cAMP/cGMP phosphodiesterase, DHH superfamily [Pseudomonas seleniipraecipitans]
MKTLCIYHANCADGFGAAWVVRVALGPANVEFHPGSYGAPAPDVEDRDVIIVDFSYKLPELLQLAQSARSVLILDHHKTAAEDLAQIPPAPAHYAEWLEWQQPLGAVFDMNRSGAGLAWDYFFASDRPALINHIEDRDLWRFELANTRPIMANVFSYPQDFEVWDRLMDMPMQSHWQAGETIERKHAKDLADQLKNARRLTIGGHDVPALNAPYFMASDAGHALTQGEPFAAVYSDTPKGRIFSLRSTDEGLDVSEIAKTYGGGGHRNAAGFTVPFDHELVTGYVLATLESTEIRVLTCVYCAHEYPQGTPAAGDQVLTDHIRQCPKHPMREAEQTILQLREALAGLLGESTLFGLAHLEAGLGLVPMPKTEKAVMLRAIQVMRDTSSQTSTDGQQP